MQATIVGNCFDDWHHLGHRYWHPFGPFGVFIDRQPFITSVQGACAGLAVIRAFQSGNRDGRDQ
jgi:hypothetical protein